MALAVMIALTLGAAAQVWYVARLFRRSLSLPLLSFLIYMILWNVLGLFEFEFLYFIRFLPQGGRMGFLLFMGLNSVVFQAGIAYFFVDFERRWTERRMPKVLKAVLVVPFAVILVLHAAETLKRLRTDPSPESFQISAPWSGNLMMAFLLLALADVFFGERRRAASGLRKSRRLFAVTTFAGLSLFAASIWGWLGIERDWFFQLSVSAFMALAANTPGIFIVSRTVLRPLHAGRPARLPDTGRRIVAQSGLTAREEEIATLILSGKNNREIAALLFISPETVKKHVYNIYQKTGVKNRLQLMNLF